MVLDALLVDVGMHLGHDLMHHHPQGVHISLLIGHIGGVGEFLKRHVLKSALPNEGRDVLFSEYGEAEVGDLEDTLLDEHIHQFQILVENSMLPQYTIAVHELPEHIEYFGLVQHAWLLQQISKSAILAALHEDVEIILRKAFDGVHLHQVHVLGKGTDYVDFLLDLLPLDRVSPVGHYLGGQVGGWVVGSDGLFDNPEASLPELDVLEYEIVVLVALQGLRHNQFNFFLHINIQYLLAQTILIKQNSPLLQTYANQHQHAPSFRFQFCLNLQIYMESKNLPIYLVVPESDQDGTTYSIITKAQSQLVPENLRDEFKANDEVAIIEGKRKTIFVTFKKATRIIISTSLTVKASPGCAKFFNYFGLLTDLLSSAYFFNRKSKKYTPPTISVIDSTPQAHRLVNLAHTRNQTREWANGRGDIEGVPLYFREIAEQFAKEHKVDITVISGQDLLKQGFRLMHAVGRASKNEPTFVNLAYRGNPNSQEWVAYVGKGVCFDSGGLDIKSASGMLTMFLDKCGATTVLAAFQTIVREQVPINLTCSLGLVQNFISENAYRPSDIIVSRKGLTVEIGNTDAEGRLVLADCMNWVQEKFKVKILIELSTLTGAINTALGTYFAGLFTNDQQLIPVLRNIGEKVHERSWHLPCVEYHTKMITPKHCDLTNSSGRTEAGSSQAAAFLKSFVEEGTKWVHFDIAAIAVSGAEATGWGSRLLVEYAHSISQQS